MSRNNPAMRKGHFAGNFVESLESRIILTVLPTGFSETVVAQNLGGVSKLDGTSCPMGRVLVASQDGTLHVIKKWNAPRKRHSFM